MIGTCETQFFLCLYVAPTKAVTVKPAAKKESSSDSSGMTDTVVELSKPHFQTAHQIFLKFVFFFLMLTV